MDHFGIGAAMTAMTRIYAQTARRTGRTTSLVESVKDGDRIVFAERMEAVRVKRLRLERGVEVDCIVVDPKNASRLFERAPSEGRTIFDHTLVERFYEATIERAAEEIDLMERQASGFGAAHRETSRCALERSKWR